MRKGAWAGLCKSRGQVHAAALSQGGLGQVTPLLCTSASSPVKWDHSPHHTALLPELGRQVVEKVCSANEVLPVSSLVKPALGDLATPQTRSLGDAVITRFWAAASCPPPHPRPASHVCGKTLTWSAGGGADWSSRPDRHAGWVCSFLRVFVSWPVKGVLTFSFSQP